MDPTYGLGGTTWEEFWKDLDIPSTNIRGESYRIEIPCALTLTAIDKVHAEFLVSELFGLNVGGVGITIDSDCDAVLYPGWAKTQPDVVDVYE